MFPGFSDVAVLGVGRRSTVYRATETGTNRPVALKVVGDEGVTPAALEAFAREYAVLAALSSHPHIVTLYRTLAVAPRPILVLELCRGSLAGRLRRGRIPVPEAVAIGVRIAGALATAHSAGVLHRNVSPANILVSDFGEPALADFAIARLHDAGIPAAELLDFPGPHSAPEVLLGQPADERTDVYGLASTLYELVSGRPPFSEMAGEPAAATILRILRDPPRALPGVPLDLSDLLMWGLAKEQSGRPPSAAWFADELRRVETVQGWPRTELRIKDAAAVVSTPPRPRLAPPPAPPAPKRRPRPAPDPAGTAGPPAGPAEAGASPAPASPPPAAAEDSTSLRRIVVRGPLLASLGRWLALLAPVWAAVTALVVAAGAGAGAVASGAAALVASAALAAWFVRPVLVLEACHLVHRDGLDRVLVPWAAVRDVRPVFEPSRRPGAPHGLLVVSGTSAHLPLPATRRSSWQLPGLAAVLLEHRAAAEEWNTF